MKALSIIGIIMSLGGVLTSIFVMTETSCYCYDADNYYGSSYTTPDEAIGGGMIMLLISVFFLIFSIIGTVVSFAKKDAPVITGSTAYTQPFTTYPPYPQQPYGTPSQNPYTQQYQNPFPPQSNQYQNNPYNTPPRPNNPYQNPANPGANPYQNPNPPKNPYAPPTPPPNVEPPKE